MTGASSSSSNSIDARGAFARPSAAALVGGAVLVASLSAAAGWMMHAARPGQPPVSAVPMHMALAPGEAVVAPTPAATSPGPATALAPAGDAAGKPSPVLVPQPRPEPQPRPQPLPAVRDTAMGSGTGHAKPALRTRPAAVCERCGTVESVHEVRRKGEANGIGAVAGGVIGGVLGRQVGKGHGRDAMTVVGAVGGGLAGHEIEKRVRAETVYEVRVRMDDGRLRTVTQKTAPQPGARVVVDGSTLRSVAARDDDART